MTTRIQLRRDLSTNWSNVNPILAEGEVGFETDTLKFKLGNNSHWNEILAYANVVPSDFNTIADGFVELIDIGAAGGVVGLDLDKNAIIPGSSIIIEGSTNNAYETTLVAEDPTADRTLTLPNKDGSIALVSDIPSITIEQIDVNGDPVESYTNITTIQFDEDSGFDVLNPSTGTATIKLNSTFKYWEIDGQPGLIANGLDTVNFLTGSGINLVADNTDGAKTFTIEVDNTIATETYADSAASSLATNIGLKTNNLEATVSGIESITTVDSSDDTEWRTLKYLIQMTYSSEIHSTEVLLANDGSNLLVSEYGDIYTTSPLGSISADKVDGIINLKITPESGKTPLSVRFFRTGIKA